MWHGWIQPRRRASGRRRCSCSTTGLEEVRTVGVDEMDEKLGGARCFGGPFWLQGTVHKAKPPGPWCHLQSPINSTADALTQHTIGCCARAAIDMCFCRRLHTDATSFTHPCGADQAALRLERTSERAQKPRRGRCVSAQEIGPHRGPYRGPIDKENSTMVPRIA